MPLIKAQKMSSPDPVPYKVTYDHVTSRLIIKQILLRYLIDGLNILCCRHLFQCTALIIWLLSWRATCRGIIKKELESLQRAMKVHSGPMTMVMQCGPKTANGESGTLKTQALKNRLFTAIQLRIIIALIRRKLNGNTRPRTEFSMLHPEMTWLFKQVNENRNAT